MIQFDRQGSGPPMVLIHGLGSNRQAWAPVIHALARHHDVLALDLPGFGSSAVLGESPTPAALARAVGRWLDGLGISAGNAHIVGNSLGGWVALELARQGQARSVVALSPAGFSRGWQRTATILYLRTLHRLAPLLPRWMLRHKGLRALAMRRMFGRPERVPLAEVLVALDAFTRCPGFDATVAAAVQVGAFEVAETIGCPITIAWGSRDLLLPPHEGQRAVSMLPGARLVPLPGLGHAPMWDDPELVAATILEGCRVPTP